MGSSNSKQPVGNFTEIGLSQSSVSNKETKIKEDNSSLLPTVKEKVDKRLQKMKYNEKKIEIAENLQFIAKGNSALIKVGVSVAAAIGSTGVGLPIAAPLLGIILIASLLVKKYAQLIKLRQVFEDVQVITSRIFLLFTILLDGYKEFGLVMNEELQINIQVKLDFVIAYLNKKFAKEMAEAMEQKQIGGGISSNLSSIKRSISSKASHVSSYISKKAKFLDLYANASKIQNELITELTLINGYFVLIYTELELSLKEIEYGKIDNSDDLTKFKEKMIKWTGDYKTKLGKPIKTLINEITKSNIDPIVLHDFPDGIIKNGEEEKTKEKEGEILAGDLVTTETEEKKVGGYYDLQNNRIRKSLYSNISKLRQKLLKRRNKYLTRNMRINKRITRKVIRK